MFQASISGLYIDQQTGEPVVLLREVGGDRTLPIWIRINEMLAFAIELSGTPPPRPFTHDQVKTVVSTLGARVTRAVVSDLEDHIYRARLTLDSESGILEIDARSSDALALALKFKAPIFVSEEVAEEQSRLTAAAGQTPEDLQNRLQKFRPEDFLGAFSAG